MAAPNLTKPDIVLNSPVGSKPAIYKWPLIQSSKGQKIDGAEEIIETIRWVAREYLEFKPAIENLLPEQPDLKSYDCIKTLCDKYNKITDFVMKMNKGTSIALKTSSRASQGLLKHIIQQVYNYSVDEPNELNKYSPFSSETYGETSFEFMAQLIDRNQFKPREQDTFIDLGSGVGHLVLQMAASVKCKKCYGIEIADRPAGYAKRMEESFKFWMNWHGKIYTEFEIIHGDFFDKKYSDIIRGSTHIFVNNFAFKPDDDHKLKQKFLDLKDGTQILSSKPFCSPKSRVSERHLSDLGSIMQVIEIQPEQKKDSVSWTPKPLPYYLHVLDSLKLQKYYERQKKRVDKSSEKGKPVKRRKTGKGSESGSEDSDDNIVYGPTTRKAWSEWCNGSALYSISKPAESNNGSNNSKIPNIVIKVKPTIETKLVEEPKLEPVPDPEPAPVVVPEPEPRAPSPKESVTKKLRQRKKSAQSDDTTGSSSTVKSVTNAVTKNEPTPPLPKSTKPTTNRPKKSNTTSSSRTALKSNQTANKKSALSPDKNLSLELLHTKTIESVTASALNQNQPAPGCENYSLNSITETPSLPKVIIKDVNMFVSSFMSSKSIDKFMESTRLEIDKFLTKLQQPNCKESLLRSIEQEKAKNRELHKAEEKLVRHHKLLSDRVTKAMKVHCDEFGIKNNTRAVVQHFGTMLRKHQDLLCYISQLESSIHLANSCQGRPMNPPPAHSNCNSAQNFNMSYRDSNPSNTLDLSLKQSA